MNLSQSTPLEFSVAVEMLGRMNAPLDPLMLARMRHAAHAGTLTILRDAKKDPVGFVCWAGGNKDSVRIAERFGIFPRHFWEFKEGKIALLMMVFFAYPCNQEAKKAFKHFLHTHRAVYYVKRERKRLMLRTSRGFRPTSLT
jgi:hypothetical protein